MILQAKRPAVLFHANSRHIRTITSKTPETEYWQDGSLKRRKLADGFWTGNSSYDLAGRLLTVDNDNSTANASNGVSLENGISTSALVPKRVVVIARRKSKLQLPPLTSH